MLLDLLQTVADVVTQITVAEIVLLVNVVAPQIVVQGFLSLLPELGLYAYCHCGHNGFGFTNL